MSIRFCLFHMILFVSAGKNNGEDMKILSSSNKIGNVFQSFGAKKQQWQQQKHQWLVDLPP